MTSLIDGAAQFFAPTHLLAVVALGLLIGQHTTRKPGVALAAFALGLLAGSVAIALAAREMPSALLLLAVAAIAGIIAVVAWRPPGLVRNTLAFATGGLLALNSPPQALTIPSAITAQAGTAVAGLVALALVTWIARKAERPWQRIGLRVVASWVAASAILVLALRLVR